MKYRTKVDLIMPEYGRNVHEMVQICMGIEDRRSEERRVGKER